MCNDEGDCKSHGRKLEGPDRAKVLQIWDLLALRDVSRKQTSGPMIRGWTYILLSCALFFRKSEAANLRLGDSDVPVDYVTGKPLMKDGLPKHLFIHIRHSKIDQDGLGIL